MNNKIDPLQQKLHDTMTLLGQNQNLGNFRLISNACFDTGITTLRDIIQTQSSMIEELQKLLNKDISVMEKSQTT